ncbi:MAG: hypothetical protein IGS03_13535 [Candidatus Sericytochromatia bacterium]|nr:hypothetical protein [Candidatus Sericytochromatia bacterium]
MRITLLYAVPILLSALMSGSASAQPEPKTKASPAAVPAPTPSASPRTKASAFFVRMHQLCGQAFEGQVIKSHPGDTLWQTARILLHVDSCKAGKIHMALHVGKDRSRSWLLSLTEGQLRLQHEHVINGIPAPHSDYGGNANPVLGSASSQTFPADAAALALFRQHRMPASADILWQLAFLDSHHLAYRFSRPQRDFQLHFDLSQPVPPPCPERAGARSGWQARSGPPAG